MPLEIYYLVLKFGLSRIPLNLILNVLGLLSPFLTQCKIIFHPNLYPLTHSLTLQGSYWFAMSLGC